MDFVLRLIQEQWFIMVVQMLVGKFVKGKEWFNNQFIPVLTWICAVLGFTLAPASAQAAAALGGVLPVVGNVLLLSLVQNLLVTGTHSTFKNTIIPTFWTSVDILSKLAAKRLQRKVAEKLED